MFRNEAETFALPGGRFAPERVARMVRKMQGGGVHSVVSLLYLRYKASTLFLAQGVLLRNCRLDLILGSLLKHLMRIILPISSQP